jgi:hypothetical protein
LLRALRRQYLKRKLGPPVTVVSGLPRSGTSMMMRMLDAAGLEIVTDSVRRADEDNPGGYFEYEPVKDLDKPGDKGWLAACRGKVVKIICFLLPHLPDDCCYDVIFMRRDLEEVIASQNKMLARRGETGGDTRDERMLQLYRQHLRKVELLLRDRPNFAVLDVEYRRVLAEPEPSARRVGAFLGRRLDAASMARAVDARLYRNRR